MNEDRDHSRKVILLCGLALFNYVAFYAIGVFLARALDIEDFGDYSVAVSTVLLMASVATLGLEKYALRLLPTQYERQDWGRARGFTIFSVRTILFLSAVLVTVYFLTHQGVLMLRRAESPSPILVGVSLLPVVAVALYYLEVAAAGGEAVRATFVYRLALPTTVAVALAAVALSGVELNSLSAVLCYGLGWLVALMLILRLASRSRPREVRTGQPRFEGREWLKRSMPFLIYSAMMTQFAASGIIVLELVGRSETEVGIYAACMQIGSFIVLVSTATNRLYAPLVSKLIDRGDAEAVRSAVRNRHRWAVPLTIVYLAVVFVFGERILAVYGPEFVAGETALILIAIGAGIGVVFAVAPYYLNFAEKASTVIGATAVAAAVNVLLLFVLGRRYGATGAALAYAISLGGLSVAFFLLGFRDIRKRFG